MKTILRIPGPTGALCGIYSIINGMRWLVSAIDEGLAKDLFTALVQRLKRIGPNPYVVLRHGVSFKLLQKLARRAAKFIEKRLAVRIKVRRLRQKQRRARSIAQLWKVIKSAAASGAATIIGLGCIQNHWSVVTTATARTLRLADSDGLNSLRRQRCTLAPSRSRVLLSPSEVLVLKRKGGSNAS